MKKILVTALLVAGVADVTFAADTANMNVTASVTATCKFTATPDAAFGGGKPD